MADNMYGYSDYHGPLSETTNESQDEETDDPLRAGLWMEGDSLAPPCGTSVPTIHRLLAFGEVGAHDVVYDLGCGDGRVCLEALVKFNAKATVGVDIEHDLIQRFNDLIRSLPGTLTNNNRIQGVQADLRQVISSFVTRAKGEVTSNYPTLPLPTVIVLYLLPESIQELEEDLVLLLTKLEPMKIICNTWGFSSIQPCKQLEIEEAIGGATTSLFLYTQECLQ